MMRSIWLLLMMLSIAAKLPGQTGGSAFYNNWKILIGANRTEFTTINSKAGYGYSYGGSRKIPVTSGFYLEPAMLLGARKTFLENIIIKPEFESDSLYYANVKATLKPVEITLFSSIALIKNYNYEMSALVGLGYGFFNIVNSEITQKDIVGDQEREWDLKIGDYSSPMGEINDGGWIGYYGIRLSVRQLDIDFYYSDYFYEFYKGGSYLVLEQKIRSLNLILAVSP